MPAQIGLFKILAKCVSYPPQRASQIPDWTLVARGISIQGRIEHATFYSSYLLIKRCELRSEQGNGGNRPWLARGSGLGR